MGGEEGVNIYLCTVLGNDLLLVGYHFNLVFHVADLAGGKYNSSFQMDAGFSVKTISVREGRRPLESLQTQRT